MSGLDPNATQRVLVQAPNWLGDFTMATPAFRAVREALPRAHVTLLHRRYLGGLIDGAPWFDERRSYDPGGADRGVRAFARTVAELRRGRYDLGILLTNSFRTALLFRLGGVRERVGYDLQGRGFLLTHRLRPEMATRTRRVPKPMPEYYLDLLESYGFPHGSDRMELFIPEACAERGRELLASLGVRDDDRIAALNPGASFGSSKLWNPASFADVGDALAREGFRVLVLFGPGEEELARTIRERMREPVLDADRIPLDLLKPVLRRTELLVTTDAGPRHVAAALGCGVVCIMGPTDPRYSATHLERTVVLREEGVECAPCHLKVCPIDHRCMERIPPSRVLEACRRLL